MIFKRSFFLFLILTISFFTLGCATEEFSDYNDGYDGNYTQVGQLFFRSELVNTNFDQDSFYVNLSVENQGSEKVLLSTSPCPVWMSLKDGDKVIWDQAIGNYCAAAMVYLYVNPGKVIYLSSHPSSFNDVKPGKYDLYVYLKSYGGINADIFVDEIEVKD